MTPLARRGLLVATSLIVAFSVSCCWAVDIPLGNLFDDAKLTDLTTAVGTDTYQAGGDTGDLGVVAMIDGNLNVAQTIAPGVSFDLLSVGGRAAAVAGGPGNDTFRSVSANAIRTTGSSSPPTTKVEDGIGMHADELVTFDLNELRNAGSLPALASYFTAKAGLNDTSAPSGGNMHSVAIVSDGSGNVLAGYVNGQTVAVTNAAGTWSFTGTLPSSVAGSGASRFTQFALPLPSSAEYLTLSTTSANGANSSDHGVFSGAVLETHAIPLGNLFDDAKGTPLATAIDTDAYQALGDVSDLAVAVQFGGNTQAAATIAPSTQFNFANIGGGSGDAGGGPGNDTWRSATNQPIRTRGVAYSGATLAGIKVEDGIGMHANDLITFDLSELRADAAVAADSEFIFRSRAGINDEQIGVGGSVRMAAVVTDANGTVLSGYVNGQSLAVQNTAGVWSFDVSGGTPGQIVNNGQFAEFDVAIPTDGEYLTLVVTGGSNVNNDHAVFSGARLLFEPVPEPTGGALALIALAGCLISTLGRRRR